MLQKMKQLSIILSCLILSACSTVPADMRVINSKWNAVPYVAEKGQHIDDCATFKRKGGDCEEYALCKRRDLLEAGYMDAEIVLGITSKAEYHAIVKAGGYYLDNRTNEIRMQPLDFERL